MLDQTARYCSDIGMFALDRPIEISCTHKTKFCEVSCFNNKLYTAFGHAMNPKDKRNESAWIENDAESLAKALSRKRHQTKRARFMTRGEALSDINDIKRVTNILSATPDTIWWLPTRAWRDSALFQIATLYLSRFDNVRILASMDPSNTIDDWKRVRSLGLSTMFYGNDSLTTTPDGGKWFKCPKTWKKLDGHCAVCKAGCFSNKPVNVYLKQH